MRGAAFLLVAAALLAAPAAEAKDARYAGVHPRTGRPDGGLCFIEAVHIHQASPVSLVLYRQVNGVWIFVGDPVPFGWDGPRVRYYGHHPVPVQIVLGSPGSGPVICYLEGPHWHPWEPPDRSNWERKEDVYYFTGPYPQEYERDKPRYVQMNDVYRPIAYERPVVVEAPPPAYHGPIVEVHVAIPVLAPPAIIVAPPPAVIVVPPGHYKFKQKKFKQHKFKGRD